MLLNKIFTCSKANFVWKISGVLSGIFSFLLALLLVVSNSVLRVKTTTEYNYQNAIEQFGLLPAVYLDLKNIIIPQKDNFVSVDNILSEEENKVIEEKPPQKNELDINFNPENKVATNDILYLNDYVNSLTASQKNKYTGIFKGKNLIFITAEAFSKPVINKDLTPTLYRLSTKGINFSDYYQTNESGTTGGEYQNIFGMLPTSGGSSFKNTKNKYNYFTMGSQLDRLGYYGKAYHNNSYTYYDRHLTHINLGYSDGFMGYGNGMEQYVEKAWPQSDYEMISGTLPTYIEKEKFNVYYMSVSGHNNYTVSENAMTKRHWEKVKYLNYSNTVKGYLAANLDLEAAVTHLVNELEKNKIADDTVIVISPDHFPYGLSSDRNTGTNYLSELYGYDINSCFDRDKTSLIIWSGSLEKEKAIIVNEPVSSIDILPTLSNLFGTEFDSRLMVGRDVFSDTEALVFYANYSFKTNLGTYYSNTGKFVPVNENTVIPEEYVNQIKTIIKNKIKYCADSQKTDYFRYLFE
ncbi:MAG: LTA synthase family protein [Clostridia bacterium]|nr:LTA synthase family protein [Clostridia bacterium]